MFEKRNLFSKLWLKYTDRARYKQYKWELKNSKQVQFEQFYTQSNRLTSLPKIIEAGNPGQQVNVSHSGNAGDIMYALPTLKKIHELTGLAIHLYLKPDQPMEMTGVDSHPLGTVMLNDKMIKMLQPLLSVQPYLRSAGPLSKQTIHIDLDYFRSGAFSLSHSNIARWCGYITGVSPELWKKWLFVSPDSRFKNKIVLARSARYRNTSIDYSFLKKYTNLVFVGVAEEYEDMKTHIPHLEWIQVDDFLELASIISSCKFFIGNQSFPFAIAEGLKVPRILEIYFHIANVIPEGENAHDFFFQDHFEWLVAHLNQ